ncbi:MAG: vitamin B12-dependent ribonucleotide reductase [Thermodesulfobacteriota bacterium]
MEISENSRKVLERRYLKKSSDGEPDETVEDMFWRVSRNISLAEKLYDEGADTESVAREFYDMMASLEFLPNSPTLMNAGRDLQQLSACFVLPIEDSMESIFEAVKHTALIHKSGGGTGFSFSRLRPSGDTVGSTSGISSGPLSFMTVFDGATEAIKQGGTRRGANMGILRVDHPNIMEFIACKEDNNKLNNFNISVSLTKKFMEALDSGDDYELINPRTNTAETSLNAAAVFDEIVQRAWENGDPGIVFIDRINDDNPTPNAGEIESTNPCGEQPLLPYESCNLGSINLSKMVTSRPEGDGRVFELDEAKLKATVKKAVHFLDNVIDMNSYPIEEIGVTTRSNRKIGLGVMGFADLLLMLGIPYDSDEAIEMAELVMSTLQDTGHKASSELAFKRGVFPNYEGSVYEKKNEPIRNATTTTIAPTGTISIISSCSSGIEPLFALAYTRTVMDGTALLEVNPLFKEVAERRGFDSEEIMNEVAKKGSLHDIEGIPDDIKRVFVTSHDITPEWHIKMQGAFQKYTDNAVSKTVNFPNDATVEDVAKVYTLAYKLGCKGVTVYRDGSRDVQVLTTGKTAAAAPDIIEESAPLSVAPTVRPRGEIAFGITKKIKTGCGNLYVTINEDEEGRPIEIFTQIGKAGGCVASQCEAMGRMTSLALRSGVDPQDITKQMRGISCHLPVGYGAGKVTSCSDAMAKAMEWYLLFKMNRNNSPLNMDEGPGANMDKNALLQSSAPNVFTRGACPDCGGSVEHADGCVVCRGCGYTECG